MLIYRRLPPFLRIAAIVGQFCFLISVVLCGWGIVTGLVPDAAARSAAAGDEFLRIVAVAVGLLALGAACTFLSSAYLSHVRSPDTRGFPFRSWQQQARITALLAALPLCAIVLALGVMPPNG